MRSSGPRAALVAVGLGLAVGPAVASAPPQDNAVPATYAALRAVELRHVGTLRDVTYQQDRIEFAVSEGELYLTEAVDGVRTGAVVLGKGRVRVEPVNAIERQQLDKYLDDPVIDLEFKKLVLRAGDDAMAATLAAAATGRGRANLNEARKQYRERHKKFREEMFYNLDSRILADLIDADRAGPKFFAADLDAKGWFSVTIDPRDREEIRITKSHGFDRAQDIWSIMHLERDYEAAAGARRSAQLGPVRVDEHWAADFETPQIHVDMALDDDDDVEALATLRVKALRDTGVIRLALSPVLQTVEAAWTEDQGEWPPPVSTDSGEDVPTTPGQSLQFVQEELGRGSREDMYDRRVVIPLPRRLVAGESLRLHVRYTGELIQKLQSREFLVRDPSGWFPQHPHAQRSQFSTTFRTPDEHRAASGGTVLSDEIVDGTRITARMVPVPTIGMSFHYGKLEPHEDDSDPNGPAFTMYASTDSTAFNPGRRDDTFADLRKALDLFRDYYGGTPFETLVIAETPATDAWAFQGFLLMPDSTFAGMHTGEAEMYRSHELGAPVWGNSVTWDTYHDVWLSEGFASYSAALYAQRALDDEDQFVDMLDAWAKDVLRGGSVAQRVGTRNYGFPPEFLRKSQGSESGAIWLGERLTSDETPPDYRLLVYEKGAFVLHMLRMLRYDWETGDDTDFRELMRTFQSRFAGKVASTEDFLDTAEEVYGEDLLWFFDQWVYGTEVPEYRPDLDARQVGGQWRLQGRIEQREASHDFRMPVPIQVELRDGTFQTVVVPVTGSSVDVDEPLRGPVDDIEFNPLWSVLANVR